MTFMWGRAQEVKREQMEEQRRAAAAARQEMKEDKKPKQAAAGPAPSMALCTAASLQRALSNDDDTMFWDYGPAAGQRGMMLLCKSSFWSLLSPCLATSSSADSLAADVEHTGRANHAVIMRQYVLFSGMHAIAIAILTQKNINNASPAGSDGCKCIQ